MFCYFSDNSNRLGDYLLVQGHAISKRSLRRVLLGWKIMSILKIQQRFPIGVTSYHFVIYRTVKAVYCWFNSFVKRLAKRSANSEIPKPVFHLVTICYFTRNSNRPRGISVLFIFCWNSHNLGTALGIVLGQCNEIPSYNIVIIK